MKCVAIFIPGGIANAQSTLYIPSYVNLISRLSLRFDVTVYSLIKPDGDDKQSLCGSAKVKYISARYNDTAWKKLFHFIKLFYYDHRMLKYNLVHGFGALPCGFVAVLVGKIFRLPSVVSIHGGETASLPEFSYGNMVHQPLRALTLWTCRHAKKLLALSQFQIDQLALFGTIRNDICIIPYGVDRELFHNGEMKIPTPPIHFIHVADINEVKDQATLLKAFSIINKKIDSRLRIIGADFMNGKLQKLSEKLGIADKIEFLGKISHIDLPKHYVWAHIMLHTSLHEGGGVVVSEAAACGTVVCGTKVGFISDLAPHSAIAVDVGDYDSLAHSVLELLKNQDLYLQLRENALRWATLHTIDWSVEQIYQSYSELLKKAN